MLRSGVVFALVAALIAASGCKKQPPDPFRLHLELAKTKIKVGEYPWYRFSITNIGRKPIELGPFLCWQREGYSEWSHNDGDWYIIQIADVSGRRIYPNDGHHPHFWTNECGDLTGCSCKVTKWENGRVTRFGPEKPLRGGETFFATPSLVAPAYLPAKGEMRPSDSDPRILSWAADDLPRARRLALAKRWEMIVEREGYLLGRPTFRSTMTATDVPYIGYPKALYPGYRVFDDISIDKPGHYRMRIIFRPLGRIATYDGVIDQIKGEMSTSDASFDELKTLFEETSPMPKETRVFLYVSNWVDFEAEAPPFPEHLFADKKFKSRCDKALNDWLRQTLRDAQIWEGDPYDKKIARHSPMELPPECRPKFPKASSTVKSHQ